jgi:prepilin-type N-terminal cleavage/methylation domain-containing protein
MHLNQKGFTLLELMVATMVTSMLIILIMTFLVNTVAKNATETARADLLREAQLTLDNIGREIRMSANADEQNRWEDENAPNAPTDLYSWESDADTLILATAATDSGNNVLFSDPLHYVTNKNNNVYFIQDGTLYKRTLADPVTGNATETSCPAGPSDSCPDDRELVHNVTNFSIRYFDNQDNEVLPAQARSIELSLAMGIVKYGENINVDFSTRTVFRNE